MIAQVSMSMAFLLLLLEEIFERLTDGRGDTPSRTGLHRWGELDVGRPWQREHLVERLLVGNEAAGGERSAGALEVAGRELQVAGDRPEGVIAQPGGVAHEDEEEVEEQLRRLEALEVAIADEAMVKPAERRRHLSEPIGAEDTLDGHGGEGNGGGSRRRSSLEYRRGGLAAKCEPSIDIKTTSARIESCISAIGSLFRNGSSSLSTCSCSDIESCISAWASRACWWRSRRRELSR